MVSHLSGRQGHRAAKRPDRRWIPFVAADVGSFFAGAVSGYLIKRGWSLGAARKAPIIYGGIGMTLLIPTIFTTNLYTIAFLFALVTFYLRRLHDHGERFAFRPVSAASRWDR